MKLVVDNDRRAKTFIEIVLGMEERGEVVSRNLMAMYQRQLECFSLSGLRETVDEVSKLFPHSKRLPELLEKIRYREQNGLYDGEM